MFPRQINKNHMHLLYEEMMLKNYRRKDLLKTLELFLVISSEICFLCKFIVKFKINGLLVKPNNKRTKR